MINPEERSTEARYRSVEPHGRDVERRNRDPAHRDAGIRSAHCRGAGPFEHAPRSRMRFWFWQDIAGRRSASPITGCCGLSLEDQWLRSVKPPIGAV